jgi:hypothetical protein
LGQVFANWDQNEQITNGDAEQSDGGRQPLAGFIAETLSNVDLPQLVNDHPWLLEVCKWPQNAANTGRPGIDWQWPDEANSISKWADDDAVTTSACVDPGVQPEPNRSELSTSDESEQAEDTPLSPASTSGGRSSKSQSRQRLPWVFCIATTLFAVAMFIVVAFYVRDRAYEVINNDKKLILCQNQNFAQVVTEWIVQDLIDTVQRSAQLVGGGTATTDFSSAQIGGSFPAVVMGIMNAGAPFVGSNPDTTNDQDACLSAKTGWGGYTCSEGKPWCNDSTWNQDLLDCCPTTCTSSSGGAGRKHGAKRGKSAASISAEQNSEGGGSLFEVWKVS